jgi:two-component system alkaline phosphatase synthesis response regulator PhoP
MFGKIAQLLGIAKATNEDVQTRCILIVDDNESDLLLIQRTVEKMGHRALIARDGKSGYDIAKGQKPDLILSDCRMPGMSGVEMCKRIKEDPETKDVPFVFLTGDETPSTIVDCFDMGADNYMCKPINPKLVAKQIKAIFEEHLSS